MTLYYDPGLGGSAQSLANEILPHLSGIYAGVASYFRMLSSPVNVIIAPISGYNDGSGGAYHYGCNFTSGGDIYIDATFAGARPILTALGLFAAELSECFQGTQAKGWNCGGSNGEALSRVHAELASGGPAGALKGFDTGPAWDQAGRPDWISQTEATDQDDAATGCGVLYIYWMMSRGHPIDSITQAGGATLADNYKALTGNSTAWVDFQLACREFPSITTDDPWTLQKPAPPTPTPAPAPTPKPTPTPAHQIVLDLDAKTALLPSGWKAS